MLSRDPGKMTYFELPVSIATFWPRNPVGHPGGVGEDRGRRLNRGATQIVVDFSPDGDTSDWISTRTGWGCVLCPHQHQPTGWLCCFTDLYHP